MFDHCQPILINNLYGLLLINTTTITNSSLCINHRQWYFFYDYGYTLLIRFINIAYLISNSYIFKIYSNQNKEKILIYDSTNSTTTIKNDIQFDIKIENSGVWVELISIKKENIQQTSFMIDYVFRGTSQSRHGRQILQDNSSFNSSQPAFIALITIIAILVLAIVIAITILCYRYYSHRQHSKKRHKIRRIPTDQAHLAASNTPSSASTYSIRSTQHLFSNHPIETPQQISSLGQSISTLPSMIPSRRLQQSMMDAYLNDFHSFQPPTTNDPKQLNSYLFIDLHSTSSETIPDMNSKIHSNDNTTTSGYDTSTGGEERNRKISLRNRRRHRRRSYNHQRQRQRSRSNLALKRSNAPRFLMRERSLPNNLIKLPQLRHPSNHILDIRDNHSSSTISNNNNQDLISTDFSLTTDDYDDSQAYHLNQSCTMDTIEEEQHSSSTIQQQYFFEMVSVHRGDDSDMPNYEDIPLSGRNSHKIGDGIAYVNDSIIV